METHNLEWFTDREMSTIICINHDGSEVEITLSTKKDCQHCHDMQERGFTFKEKLHVHRAPDTTCVSCEG